MYGHHSVYAQPRTAEKPMKGATGHGTEARDEDRTGAGGGGGGARNGSTSGGLETPVCFLKNIFFYFYILLIVFYLQLYYTYERVRDASLLSPM